MSTPLRSLSNFIHNWQEDNFKVQCKNCDKWFKCGKRNLANIKRHLSYVHGFEMGSAYDNKWDNKNRNPLLLSDEELFESQEMNEPEEISEIIVKQELQGNDEKSKVLPSYLHSLSSYIKVRNN